MSGYVDTSVHYGHTYSYEIGPYFQADPPVFTVGNSVSFPTPATRLTAQYDPTANEVNLTWSDPSTLSQEVEIQWSNDNTNFYTIDMVFPSECLGNDGLYHYTDADPEIGPQVTDYYRVVGYSAMVVPDSNDFEAPASNVAQVTPCAPPVAFDDGPGLFGDDSTDPYTTKVDYFLNVDAAQGVLANDFDPNGRTLTVYSYIAPPITQGILSLDRYGGFTFTPSTDFTGDVTFTYTASNGVSQSDPATVTIVVANTPVKAFGNVIIDQNSVAIPGIAGPNDSNPDNSKLTYNIVENVQNGTLNLNAQYGTFTYTPHTGFSGIDGFSYNVSDGYQTSNTAFVEIAVGNNSAVATHASGWVPSPAQAKDYPLDVQGLFNAYSDAMQRYSQTLDAMEAYGQALINLSNSDPTTLAGAQAEDAAVAKFDAMNIAYDAYLACFVRATDAAGNFMKDDERITDGEAQAINDIGGLAPSVPGLQPSQTRANQIRMAIGNFAAGADWLVANNGETVQATKDLRDSLLVTGAVVGAVGSGGALAQGGVAVVSSILPTGTAAWQVVAAQFVVASSLLYLNGRLLQGEFAYLGRHGVDAEKLRIGAEGYQMGLLLTAQYQSSIAQAESTAATVLSDEDPIFSGGYEGQGLTQAQVDELTANFRASGGEVDQSEDMLKFLKLKDAGGVAFNAKLIGLPISPTRTAVYEELIHAQQYADGDIDASPQATAVREVDAAEKLIANQREWSLPANEIAQVVKNLAYWRSVVAGQ